MSKETPKDDPRKQTDQGSHKQTDKPWKGNPGKEQRSGTKKSDPDKVAGNEHALDGVRQWDWPHMKFSAVLASGE
jgi:hypothetical protein